MSHFINNKEYTHSGILKGIGVHKERRIWLRETKLHWITPRGRKFRKMSGSGIGDWPTIHLDISTLREEL